MDSWEMRRGFLFGAIGAGFAARAAASVCNVTEFGAGARPTLLDTGAIQRAIDACAARGGGTVYFPAGRYVSGGLILRGGVHLYLEAGAVLAGSTRLEDFPVTVPKIRSYTDNYTERSFIYGEGLENVGIHGDGVVDGQGAAYHGPYKVRPYLIRIVSSRDVSVTGVTIRDSPMWVQHYLDCEDVHIQGITVASNVNANNDGIDIDCSERVTISDCRIDSGDDAIVLKSTSARPTRDVTVSNCVLRSRCNAFKLGTESNGGFRNIALANCAVHDTRLSGIAVEMVDGGTLEGVSVSNVVMRDVRNPIFIRLGDRGRPYREGGAKPGPGVLRGVRIAHLRATGASRIGCAISGIPGHAIEDVAIEGVSLEFEGGVTGVAVPREVPEKEADYPEHQMFGVLPAYAFFCRHMRGILLRGVTARCAAPDERPAVVCDDAREVEIDGCRFASVAPAIRLRAARGVFIRGCTAPAGVPAFVELEGASERVSLVCNDLNGSPAVRGGQAFIEGNRA